MTQAEMLHGPTTSSAVLAVVLHIIQHSSSLRLVTFPIASSLLGVRALAKRFWLGMLVCMSDPSAFGAAGKLDCVAIPPSC